MSCLTHIDDSCCWMRHALMSGWPRGYGLRPSLQLAPTPLPLPFVEVGWGRVKGVGLLFTLPQIWVTFKVTFRGSVEKARSPN